jgi:hypothetical protein
MPNYSSAQKEETFKAAVFRDFFSSSKYAYEPNIGNIDFIVTEAKTLNSENLKNLDIPVLNFFYELFSEIINKINSLNDMIKDTIFDNNTEPDFPDEQIDDIPF